LAVSFDRRKKRGTPREIVGLEIDWPQVESIYEEVGFTTLGFTDGFESSSAGVQRGSASWKGYDEYLVADAKEDDCPGDSEAAIYQAGNKITVRDHCGSCAASSKSNGGEDNRSS
jgi:hypothetical protein